MVRIVPIEQVCQTSCISYNKGLIVNLNYILIANLYVTNTASNRCQDVDGNISYLEQKYQLDYMQIKTDGKEPEGDLIS